MRFRKDSLILVGFGITRLIRATPVEAVLVSVTLQPSYTRLVYTKCALASGLESMRAFKAEQPFAVHV